MAMPSALPRALMLMAMVALATGVLAGLARLAVVVPPFAASQAGHHGALMIAGFLGTVIALERAVALAGGGLRWPFLGPLAAGLGSLCLLADLPIAVVHALFAVAGLILTIGSALLFIRQPATHLATLALGAAAWLGGLLVWPVQGSLPAAVPWWITFLLLTIAGERLELTRLLPTSRAARRLFGITAAVLLLGPLLALWQEQPGLQLLAAGCIALALWLLRQDIVRHTVKQQALTRYIAACLLSGYAWLAFGGVLGIAGGFAPGSAWRDAALHAIFVGFVMAMIFGHAPIIFPAVAKLRIPYHPVFYLPLALLHLSLLGRTVGDLLAWPDLARAAATGNALTLLLFALIVLARAFLGRRSARR